MLLRIVFILASIGSFYVATRFPLSISWIFVGVGIIAAFMGLTSDPESAEKK